MNIYSETLGAFFRFRAEKKTEKGAKSRKSSREPPRSALQTCFQCHLPPFLTLNTISLLSACGDKRRATNDRLLIDEAPERKKTKLAAQNSRIEQLEASIADLQEELTAARQTTLVDKEDQHLLVNQIRNLQHRVQNAASQRANDIQVIEQQQQLLQHFDAHEQSQRCKLRTATIREDAAEDLISVFNKISKM